MENNNKIIYISFNLETDNKYFLIGTKAGCTIYQAEAFKKGFNLGK